MGCLTSTKGRLFIIGCLGLGIGAYMAMGCGSSGSAASGSTSDTGSTAADTSSLKSVPTTDVSSYDPTTAASTSSSESVEPSKSVSKAEKAVTEGTPDNKYDTRVQGRSSRMGCEQNAQKRQIIRDSQQAQMDRCFLQGFEAAGFYTIPTGSRTALLIIPPTESADERSNKCAGIPAERVEELAACKTGGEGASGGAIAARVGVIDGALEIDVCEGKTRDSLALVGESKYTSTPSFSVVRIGKWQGKTEKNTIAGTLTGATISNGDVTLSDTGSATITASMDGGHGSGNIKFTATKLNYTLEGGFKGAFKDPFSESETSFTGKVSAQVGKEKAADTRILGTGKFSFTGAPPAMSLKNVIPYDMAGAQLENFLKNFGADLGVVLTLANYETVYICPNPDFNPGSPSVTVKPMTFVAKGVACTSVTHTGTESFEVTTRREASKFASQLGALASKFAKIDQTFVNIPDTDSPFFAAVSAKDLSTISADAGTIAFARNWDCKGATEATTLDMQNPTAAQIAKMEALGKELFGCFALEESLRDNDGMGGHDCGGGEMKEVGENIKDSPPSFGNAGGDLARTATTCNPPIDKAIPDRLFVNVINVADKKYGLAVGGKFTEFAVTTSTVSGLSIEVPAERGSMKVTQIAYQGAPGAGVTAAATSAVLTYFSTGGGFPDTTCTGTYSITVPTPHTKPTEPTAAELPSACKAKGITNGEQCKQFCSRPENKCF